MPDSTLPETGSGRDEFLKSPQMRAVVSKLEDGGREGAQGGAGEPAGDLRAGQQDSGRGGLSWTGAAPERAGGGQQPAGRKRQRQKSRGCQEARRRGEVVLYPRVPGANPLGGQCRQRGAVYYSGGPKAASPLSRGPRPVFVKTLYTLSVSAQTHLPKFPETSLNKGKERSNQR